MRQWLLSAAMVALVCPAVQAQMTAPMNQPATEAGEVAKGRYLVFFNLNSSRLNPAAREVVAEAATEFRNSGQSRIDVVGHTDTSGNAEYNQRLSERRAEAVRTELVRLGVPDSAVMVSGAGQNDLLVPTADNVREPQNRRVEIVVPQPPPPPAPMPVAEQPPPAPPSPPKRHPSGSRSSWAPSTATTSASPTSRIAAARPRTIWRGPSSPSTLCLVTSSASA